jgi:hypothetical protein
LSISNATLTVSNWFTQIRADEVAILNLGCIGLPPAFADGAMSNRIAVTAAVFRVEAGGTLNADGKGFLVANGPAKGSQSGSNNNSGGGHGGRGGDEGGGSGGPEWGLSNAPVIPGSGGGRWTSSAYPTTNGCGGGVIRIEADTVVVNGVLSARGTLGLQYDGGGAGGAIWITCTTFAGTNGVIQTDGGNGGSAYGGGGGGGGRIALDYTALSGPCSVRFTAMPGPLFNELAGGIGTFYLSRPDFITPARLATLFHGVRLLCPGWNALGVASLTLSSNTLCLGETGFTLTVTNDLVIQSNAWLTVGGKAYSAFQTEGLLTSGTNPLATVNGNLVLNG